jgi:hypothetical protein
MTQTCTVGATKPRSGLFILGVPLLGSLVVMDPPWAQSEVSFTRQDFGVGDGPSSVTVGDFNGDGRQDLATTNRFDNTVSILLGNGDGTFEPAQDFEVLQVDPASITVGDFNGDSQQDLATANFLQGTVSILLGQGDGTFQWNFQQSRAVAGRPNSIAVGDFNGDGRQDLATADDREDFPAMVSILLGQGDGTLQAAQFFGLGAMESPPLSVTVGDFNGDARQDVVVGGDFTVAILLGASGTAQDISGLRGTVTVGDFNGDARQDLATASAGTVSISLGNGDGTFEPAQDFGVGLGPASITVGDFNGDSQQDLATANFFGSVSILLGQGDGTFEPAQDFGVGEGAFSVTVGDFNGDGQQDVATANFNDSTVSILINNTAVEIAVKIDIKLGGFPNSINPRSKGVIPVAILTTDTFDASAVDPTTVFFGATGGEAAPAHSALEDVDGDGSADLVLHFRTQDTGIVCGTTSASLRGKTLSGQAIEGSDSIRTVGCK